MVVEIVRYPQGAVPGEAVIMEVLGSSKNPAVDTLAVMRQFGLAEEFPEEVIAQARAQADAFVEGEIAPDRRDLTKVVTLTIDPFDARDFDDAISLSKNEKGHWELMVHIADVATSCPSVHRSMPRPGKEQPVCIFLTASFRCCQSSSAITWQAYNPTRYD